jgi:hypothetical protein
MAARITLIVLACVAAIAQVPDKSALLGVLEEVPGVYAGESSWYGVRVIFQKQGEEWRAFPNECSDLECLKALTSKYPRDVTWTITFNGRSLGSVTGRTPTDFAFYSHVGIQKIVSPGTVPSVGNRSTTFADVTGIPVHCPLIANSQPYFRDPEAWKSGTLSIQTRPLAGGLPGRDLESIPIIIEAFDETIDPSEAQRLSNHVLIRNQLRTHMTLIEHKPDSWA